MIAMLFACNDVINSVLLTLYGGDGQGNQCILSLTHSVNNKFSIYRKNTCNILALIKVTSSDRKFY